MRSSLRTRLSLLLAVAAVPVVAVAGASAADESGSCPSGQGEHRKVEAGIAVAIGCFTESTKDGATVYNAKGDVDLNGFIVTPGGEGLSIATESRRVWAKGAVLKSRNWPVAGKDTPLGKDKVDLNFYAPEKGSLLIEDLQLGSNGVARAIAGFSPFGGVETPVRIGEDGKGSMDVTITLAGYFTLKGKPQSAVVKLPTESEKGTWLDGFQIELKEIDSLKAVEINDFEAEYSAEEKKLAAGATLSLPFMKGKGFGGSFSIENGKLTSASMDAAGLEIPIGAAPPAGTVTEIGGGFEFLDDDKGIGLHANLGADFGPEIPSPWGKVAPIAADAALKLGYDKGEAFFTLNGGIKIFRLPVGSAYLGIYTNTGVKFGGGIGIGFPSYRDKSSDPFYIGAHIDGWVAKGKYQFSGDGRVALFNAKLFDGNVLVNNRAVGACWKVLWFPGGAVYQYGGTKIKTFGVGCGLDAYREQFPRAAGALAAGSARTVRLDDGQIALSVKGEGGPPRFVLRSADGSRSYRTPEPGNDIVVRRDHAFFVNDTGTNTTHLMLRRPRGTWRVEPLPGSPAITSLKAGRRQAPEHVRAEVRGRGRYRTLVWRSEGRANTRLIFTERMRGGLEIPILDTDRANGRHRFRVAQGSHYGRRALRVVVKHGYGSRQAEHLDRYRVAPPARVRGPRAVRAHRDLHDVRVRWSRVRAASGYLVELVDPRAERGQVVRYARRVGPRRRALSFRRTVGGGRLIARVRTLNSDGRSGPATVDRFAANPRAGTLAAAARGSVRSARVRRGAARLRTVCPGGGHCQVRVVLRRGGRVVGAKRFQQPPDTFRSLRVAAGRSAGAAARGRTGPLRVVVEVDRAGRDGRPPRALATLR